MKRILFICFLIPVFGISQDLSAWDKQVIEEANTAQSTSYLTENEKKVILLMNLARINGSKFYETIAKPYMEGMQPDSYTRSLVSTLKKTKGLPMLTPNEELYELARDHAKKMGQSGKVGHEAYLQRMKPYRNSYNGLGENCDYGFNDPLSIVMRLLIDDGNPNYGHREAILSSTFIYTGVSIQPHKRWTWNCVQEFGGEKL